MSLLVLLKIVTPIILSNQQVFWVESAPISDHVLRVLKVRLASHVQEYNKSATALISLYDARLIKNPT